MIFELISKECIGALVTTQSESTRLGRTSVSCELMMLGVIDRPERVRKSLKGAVVNLRKGRLTVENLFWEDADAKSGLNGNNDTKAGRASIVS